MPARRCLSCRRPLDPFDRCRRRRCPSYSAIWAGDQRVKLQHNLCRGYDRYRIITVTGPGSDNLLTYDGHVDRDVARHWNGSAPIRWRKLLSAARLATKRSVGGSPRLSARVWQYQRRGILHVHLLVPAETELERIQAEQLAQNLSRLAESHGFGFVDRKPLILQDKRAAGYVAHYFEGKSHQALTETVKHEDVPGQVVYIDREITQRTRCTMRTLRLRRYAWRIAVETGHDPAFIYRLLIDFDARLLREEVKANAPPADPPRLHPRACLFRTAPVVRELQAVA